MSNNKMSMYFGGMQSTDFDYVCGSRGTTCIVLITECHNSRKHRRTPLASLGGIA